jgi:hypothetical protein
MVEAEFKVLFWHSPGVTEENYKTLQTGWLVSRLGFEPKTS